MPGSDMNDLNRELGALSAQVHMMATALAKVTEKLEKLEQTMTEAKGGWKTLAALAGLAGGTAGFVATLAKFKVMGG